MAKGGWIGVVIPRSTAVAGGASPRPPSCSTGRVRGAAMNGCSALHLTMFGLNPVVKFGNERLKETFLPRAAAGDLHVAFGVTEPDAGTDTSRITTARRGRQRRLDLPAARSGPSKALESEVVLLLVRTEDDGSGFGGLTLFLADLDPATSTSSPIPKMGRNAVASCEVAYDGLPVEGWRWVGEAGEGSNTCCTDSTPSDPAGRHGVRDRRGRDPRAVAYAKEREVFGRRIGANQVIGHPLAQAHMDLQSGLPSSRSAPGGVTTTGRVRRGGEQGQVPRCGSRLLRR